MCIDSRITKQTFLLYQCIHGLGHGLMIYTGYDLPLSLNDLQEPRGTEFDKISCSGGVFMENFSSSYGVTSKYLRKNDPIYPCNDKISDPYKVQCYGLVTANLLRTTGYDQKKTAAGCKRSEPEWVGTCFESFGRDVSGIAGRSAAKARASCRLAGKRARRERLPVRRRARDRQLRRGARARRALLRAGEEGVPLALLLRRRLGDVGDRDRRDAARDVPADRGRNARSCFEGAGLEAPQA